MGPPGLDRSMLCSWRGPVGPKHWDLIPIIKRTIAVTSLCNLITCMKMWSGIPTIFALVYVASVKWHTCTMTISANRCHSGLCSLIFKTSISPETCAFLADWMLLAFQCIAAILCSNTTILKIYSCLARVESHYWFVATCLRSSTIPLCSWQRPAGPNVEIWFK